MIKQILVHVDATPEAEARLTVACDLTRRHDAQLVGVHVLTPPDLPPSVMAEAGVVLLDMMRDAAEKAAAKAKETFQARVAREGLRSEWRLVSGFASDTVAVHARYSDLAIVGQPTEDAGGAITAVLPEEVALHAGRPVLVVPYAWKPTQVATRVLIGWDASREATRAVNDAMPLLTRANAVKVLVVNGRPSDSGHGEVPGADIALHLARHGVKVEAQRTLAVDIGVGETLLSAAADEGADLLVMGCYGHSRLREAVFGGATNTLLRSMTVPVLLAH